MVYFFTSNGTHILDSFINPSTDVVVDPPALLYMGHHKEENEEMLQHGRPSDIWFHVDDLSSAHVYLEVNEKWLLKEPAEHDSTNKQKGQKHQFPVIDLIPENLLNDCCQLVKYNSIEGNKRTDVSVIYTPFTNLLKLPVHAPGQVSYKSERDCRYCKVEKRQNEIIRRLERTCREEKAFDWRADEKKRDDAEKEARRRAYEAEKAAEKKRRLEVEARKSAESYESVMRPEKMTLNKFDGPVDIRKYEEDFF